MLPQYFAGELAEPEAARLREWIGADPDHAAAVAELRAVWEATGEPSFTWDASAALQRIKQSGTESGEAALLHSWAPGAGATLVRDQPWWRLSFAAAALVVVTAAGIASWRFGGYGDVRQNSMKAPLMTELVTRRGQRADLLLPDGTRVTLGVDSRLRYPTRYAGSSRDLYLDGEAYFQVAHDATKPFRVHTVRGIAEDVGTAFGVRAYGPGELEVVVAEGAVVLRSTVRGTLAGDSAVLMQADLGNVDADGRVRRASNVDLEASLAWQRGKLVFHNTSVREVLHRLGQWYDIDLELADSAVADRPFTASFDNEPVDRVLNVLAVTVGLRYEQRGSLRLVFAR